MTKTYPYIILLTIICFGSVPLHSQDARLSTVINKTVADGLADRTVYRVIGDSLGRYFFHTPLAVQKHFQDKIVKTVMLPTVSQRFPMMEGGDFLFVIDDEECISVIDKNDLIITKKVCISDIIDGQVVLIQPYKDGFMILTQSADEQFLATSFEFDDDSIIPIYTKKFAFSDGLVSMAALPQDDLIFIINDNDELYAIGDEPQLLYQGCQDFDRSRTPKIYVDDKEQSVYFSLENCPGVFSLDDNLQLSEVINEGYMQFATRDQAGNTILGITNSTILHCDYLLQIDKEGTITNRPKILETNNRITDMYSKDFDQSIVVGTYNGIYFYEFLESGVGLFLQREDIGESEFGHVVRGFTQDDNQQLLIVKEGGEDVYLLQGDSLYKSNELSPIVGYGTVWIDYDAPALTTWILEYDREGKSTLYGHHTENGINRIDLDFTAEKFHVDKNEIWVAGRKEDKGIIYKVDSKTHIREYILEAYLTDSHVRASYYGEDLYVFGTYNGLLIYDRFSQRLVENEVMDSFRESVTFIRKFSDQYFIGTYSGLYVFDNDFSQIKYISLANSRAGNVVASIEQDSYDNFWISTFSGMIVLNAQLDQVHKFTSNEILSSGEFNRSASYKDNKGYLYFGAINGFVRVEPKTFFAKRQNDRLLLNQLDIYQDNRAFTRLTNPNDQIINGLPKRLSFHFVRPGFNISASQNNIANYELSVLPVPDSIYQKDGLLHVEGLSFGSYQIYGRRRFEGAVRQHLASIQIARDWPSIWRNLLAILGTTAVFGLLLFRYFDKKQKRVEEKLTLENEIVSVRLKALRSQLNPHFIFNALNSIQFYIQTNEKKLARNYLNKFARLIRLILESSHYDHISIAKEIEQLTLYLELEKLRFEDKWDFNVEVSDDINQESLVIPSMVLQPIIENAVMHGVGHLTDRKGLININVYKEPGSILVTVEDNGIGRQASMAINAVKKKGHISLSTNISNTRMDLLNTLNSNSYTIDYRDSQSEGTIVTVKIKDTLHDAA